MIIRKDHVSLTSSQEIRQICSPLKQIGITYFCYSRSYQDGGRIYLDYDPESLEDYFLNKYYAQGNTEGNPSNYKSPQILLWSTLPKQFLYESLKSKEIGNGMFMIEPGTDSCEFYGFAGDINNRNLYNTYLSNVDFLKQFISYFKEKASILLKQSEKDKLYFPFHNEIIISTDLGNTNDLLEKNDHKYPKLSQQQLSCAKLLLAGKKYKEIAKELVLSPRTIESYFDNLRSKLKCCNKAELIVKLTKLIK